MDDFEELVGDLKAGAERRRLRSLDATFPGLAEGVEPGAKDTHRLISFRDQTALRGSASLG